MGVSQRIIKNKLSPQSVITFKNNNKRWQNFSYSQHYELRVCLFSYLFPLELLPLLPIIFQHMNYSVGLTAFYKANQLLLLVHNINYRQRKIRKLYDLFSYLLHKECT